MSQNCATVDGDAGEAKKALTLESLQRYLASQAEEREAAADRAESILARFFKVGIVIVCLNVVIAGANVAMILIRPSSPHVLPPPVSAAVVAEPTRPAAAPQMPAPEPQVKVAAQVQPAPPQATPALPTPAAVAKLPEKRIPLLGPLPSSPRSSPIVVKRSTQPLVRPALAKTMVAAEDAAEDADEGPDERPSSPPERW
jgi:hypothetical protein